MGDRRARRARTLTIAVLAMVMSAILGWALATVLRPIEDPLEVVDHALVTVERGTVETSMVATAVAQWTSRSWGVNRARGVVTSIPASSDNVVDQGDILYTVDLRPVVIAEGEVPSFRDIGEGDAGDDVRQLQRLLSDRGLYRGRMSGKAGPETAEAIRAWQRELDVESTGISGAGDIVFVETLPARIRLDAGQLTRGDTLDGGERLVSTLSSAPDFALVVTVAQAGQAPIGTRVEITGPEGVRWTAEVAGQERDPETDLVTLDVTAEGGGAVCGAQCAAIPVGGETTMPARVVTQEPVEGLVVPSIALVSSATGGIELVDADGARIAVTVGASAHGMSVVEGVEEGLRVRIPSGPGQ